MGYTPVTRLANDYRVYKVIPHRSVLNSQNRRLWAVVHELLSMYASLSTRATRNGYGVQIRAKDDVWWFVRMKLGNIEFYLALTDKFDDVFKLRLANHEQWRHLTLEESERFAIEEKHTSVAELKLMRDNMFALETNHAEQTSPLRNILDVSHQLKEGDKLTLAIRLECVPRMKGKRMMEYSWNVWENGKVPHRNEVRLDQGMKSLAKIGATAVNEVVAVTEDAINAIERSIFAGRSEVKIGKIEIPDAERQRLLVNGHLSTETRNKQNLPLFKSTMRVYAHSQDAVRRDMLAQSLTGAFVELSGDNRLIGSKGKPAAIDEVNALRYATIDRDPMILSTDEVGKIIQLPTADLQQEYKEEIVSNQRTEIEVPVPFRDESGIYMGSITKKGSVENVYLPTGSDDALFTPRAFVASPRMGKDTTVVNFVVDAKKNHGIGSIILDAIDERGERGMSDAIRDVLGDDVIDLNLADYEWPIYLGLQGIATNNRMATNRIAQELTAFLGAEEGSRMQEYLFACAKVTYADPVLIGAILRDGEVRRRVLKETDDEDVRYLLEDFDRMSQGMQAQIAAPVLTRLSKIMGDSFLKPIFGQTPNPKVDFGKWIREGKVVIVRIPTRDLGPSAVRIILHWLTLVVFLTKVAGCGGRTFVVYNEPHIYESEGWLQFVERMLLEGPKYRIAPIFAFHLFSKLSKGFVDVLMAAGVNWHIGNNSSVAVFRQLKEVLEPSFTPEEAAEQVKARQWIAAWRDGNGEYQPAFLYDAPEPAVKRYGATDRSELTRRHSREYGRALAEVEREIGRKHRAEES